MLQTLVWTVNDPWSTVMGNKVMFCKLRFISFAMSIYHSSTSILLQFLGNSSQENSQSPSIEWNVASQAILSSASVWQNTLPSLLDMMISMDPLAFLLLGIQIIWLGVSSVIWLAPLSAINTVVEEKSASGNNFSLTYVDKWFHKNNMIRVTVEVSADFSHCHLGELIGTNLFSKVER
jgi:hypothetical protein